MRKAYEQIAWILLALLVGFLVLWPIIQLEQRAFADNASAFVRMLAMPGFSGTLQATVYLAFGSSVLALVIGTSLAWCAAHLPLRARRVGQMIPLMPLALPAIAAVYGWIFMLSPKVGYLNLALRQLPFLDGLEEGPFDIYSLPWIIIVTALLLSSFVYLFVQTGLQNMGDELDAAAAACGASPLRRFFTITLPLLRPSLVYATSVVFLLGLGQFTVPLLLGRTAQINVLTTEMFYLTLEPPVDYGRGAALGFPILVIGLLLVVFQRFAIGEQRRFIVVSARSNNQGRKPRWWSVIPIVTYALVTTIIPLAALLYVSLSPFWSGDVSLDRLTLRHYYAAADNPLLARSIITSVVASLVAVAVLIPLGFACAFALLRTTRILRWARTAIDVAVTLPVAIPASLFGFGILFAYSQAPFMLYGTTTILIVTYVTLMIGYASRLQFSTLLAIGNEFREASYASGAGPLRTLLLVMLPMSRKGIAATAALTFVLLSHEFSASMMVRSIRTQVMGSLLYDIWTSGVYPEAAVLALIMVAVTVVGVLLAVRIGGADSLRKL